MGSGLAFGHAPALAQSAPYRIGVDEMQDLTPMLKLATALGRGNGDGHGHATARSRTRRGARAGRAGSAPRLPPRGARAPDRDVALKRAFVLQASRAAHAADRGLGACPCARRCPGDALRDASQAGRLRTDAGDHSLLAARPRLDSERRLDRRPEAAPRGLQVRHARLPAQELPRLREREWKGRFAAGCETRIGGFPSGAILRRLTARKARAFSCRLPADARISIRQIKRTYQVDLGTSSSRVASAKLRNSGSVLDFSRSSCNPGKPPS